MELQKIALNQRLVQALAETASANVKLHEIAKFKEDIGDLLKFRADSESISKE